MGSTTVTLVLGHPADGHRYAWREPAAKNAQGGAGFADPGSLGEAIVDRDRRVAQTVDHALVPEGPTGLGNAVETAIEAFDEAADGITAEARVETSDHPVVSKEINGEYCTVAQIAFAFKRRSFFCGPVTSCRSKPEMSGPDG